MFSMILNMQGLFVYQKTASIQKKINFDLSLFYLLLNYVYDYWQKFMKHLNESPEGNEYRETWEAYLICKTPDRILLKNMLHFLMFSFFLSISFELFEFFYSQLIYIVFSLLVFFLSTFSLPIKYAIGGVINNVF
jgi:hypothetical protein